MEQEKSASRQAHPLKVAAIVIYATLFLLAVTIPQAVPNWLKGFEPGGVQRALLDASLAVQSLANRMGVNVPFHAARRVFLATTGKSED
jgi:hypothetical protein